MVILTAIEDVCMPRGSEQKFDTSLGLLGRVQQGDSEAWREFSCRCLEVIQQWCRWRHMHLAESDDVVQNSMLVVLKKIGSFKHSGRGSFRAWLRAIAWRCWSDAVARAGRVQAVQLTGQYELAIDEIAELERRYEALRRMQLMQRAMLIVRQRVTAATWKMFYRTALGDEYGAVVAAEMQVSLSVVYASRSRVQRMLHQQVQLLERLEDSEGEDLFPTGEGTHAENELAD